MEKKLNEKETALCIGNEYLTRAFTDENAAHIRDMFRELAEINHALFSKIDIDVIFTPRDVYANSIEMRARVLAEKKIYIYSGGNIHPFLSKIDNLKGRAIHDFYAHIECRCPFSFSGELNAWNTQRELYPAHLCRLLFSEIVGQTAAFYAAGKSHDFKQRGILAPDDWINAAAPFIK